MLKKGTPASPATAREISVLLFPEDLQARDPWNTGAEGGKFIGKFQELDDFL